MKEVSKADWKLFRARIGGWQERHMETLVEEYKSLLESNIAAYEKFWTLEKRIKSDRKTKGVLLELNKSNVPWDVAEFMKDGIITEEDLDGFSDEMKEEVKIILGRWH